MEVGVPGQVWMQIAAAHLAVEAAPKVDSDFATILNL